MSNQLINREDLKRKLQYVYSCEYIGSKSKEGIVSDIIEEIDNAPAVEERPQGKWILVSKELPERYKEVIVTDIETSGTYVSRYVGNEYWECDNGPFKNRIIAWQPLPEPYKEKDND